MAKVYQLLIDGGVYNGKRYLSRETCDLFLTHTSNADAICSNAVYSLLKEDDMLFVGTYMGGLSYTPVSYTHLKYLCSLLLMVNGGWLCV